MNAELRRIYSPDAADLALWRPDGPSWSLLLQLMVGPADAPGEESFEVTLCSAAWLQTRAAQDGIVDLRHCFVTENYDYATVVNFFAARVSRCSGDDWAQVAAKLSRIGHWEFEDYVG